MESKFWFLSKYSLSKKLKNKWFLIGNIIVAIIIIGLVNIDSIVGFFGGDFNDDVHVKIIDNAGFYTPVKTNLKTVNDYLSNSKIIISKEDKGINDVKKKIKGTKDIILVLNKDDKNVFNVDFISDSYVDTITYQAISTSLNTAKKSIAISESSISEEELSKISSDVNIKRSFVDKEKTKDEENSKNFLSIASIILVLPCFILIVFLIQMIGAEINEEKSSHGMEIIIGNVSAKTHFASKVFSSNLFVLIQGGLLLLYGAIGLIVRKLTSDSNTISKVTNNLDINGIIDTIKNGGIIDKLGYIIPLIIILLLLSFLAYSLMAGILASMTTNMENYQQLQTPLMIISLIGYYLILISSAFPGATFIKIMSVIPLISISLAPSLLLSGEINALFMILAILLVALLDFLLIRFGLRIYKAGILNYSENNLWKKIIKSVKEK